MRNHLTSMRLAHILTCITTAGENMEKRQPSNTSGRNTDRSISHGKQYGGFLKRLKWICYLIQ